MSAIDDVTRALNTIRAITSREQTTVRLQALELMSSMIASELLILRSTPTATTKPKPTVVTKTRVVRGEAAPKPKQPQPWLPALLTTLDQPAPKVPKPMGVIRPVAPIAPKPTIR